MSKKKSLAWGRKTTGHISKGVLNYGNIEKMGRKKSRLNRRTWRDRWDAKRKRHIVDAARQVAEAHIDWNAVRALLNLGMTLDEAKANV